MSHELKVRYSDQELQEFKTLIENKLQLAFEEHTRTQQQINDLNENGFNQQGGDLYDDSTAHTDLELLQRMASRQTRYIQDLRNALQRIQNKSYGICTVTGQLIDKNRLRLVPHATKSVDGKNLANSGVLSNAAEPSAAYGTPLSDNDSAIAVKPVSEKVRIPGSRQNRPAAEEWEMDNETIEDAGYRQRKFEEDEE